jgi:hypothetical protein
MNIMKTIFAAPWTLSALALLPAALCMSACSFSPAPVVRYRAESPGALWDHGMELHASAATSLEIRTGFLELSKDLALGYPGPQSLFFLISAENRSNSAVLVDPLDFRIRIPGGDSILSSIDPEAVILRARQDQATEDASYAGRMGTALGLGLVESVLDLATAFAPSTREQDREWEESKERSRQDKEDIEARHRERTDEISARRIQWSDSALRKTTLRPGGTLRGRVGFAVGAYAPPPDSLLIQYREKEGRHIDLITYGIIRDTALAKRDSSRSPVP